VQHDDQSRAGYEAPDILELGDAAELTTGNTANYTDYLGDTSTQYRGGPNEPGPPGSM
jgi:hypothetical protein